MIRVLVVDDSAIARKMLTEGLSRHEDIDVVGGAVDPYIARDKIIRLRPDVITLDLEMPRMDGLSFLSRLMKHFPIPVVVVSSLTPGNSDTALKALALGAVDVIGKPDNKQSSPELNRRLAAAVRTASSVRMSSDKQPFEETPDAEARSAGTYPYQILAVGASTGGTTAIKTLLSRMPASAPGIVIVQHMPAGFTTSFARHLNEVCPVEVREACDRDRVTPGTALLAPGNHHMLLQRNGMEYTVRIKDGPPVHHQRPSVDVLFQSVARHAGSHAVGVILTGMGADGAKGLLAMRRSGAFTIAQDEHTAVVFGMPKAAIELDAVDSVSPLPQIAETVIRRSTYTPLEGA